MHRRLFSIAVLLIALAITRLCAAADLSGDWVGQLTGQFDHFHRLDILNIAFCRIGIGVVAVHGKR